MASQVVGRTAHSSHPGADDSEVEHFDVVIVGAGISGIGAAYHLRTQCPTKSLVVFEALESFGGTWHVHRYPGIRSDSDLYTFGYRFKPWTGTPVATASEILHYLDEVIEENALDRYIRYQHSISDAQWSSATKTWTLNGIRGDTGEPFMCTASFLWMCQGYYHHATGHTPIWPGTDDFRGRIVHPQTWPDDLDYAGKRVVVIGSGATTATLVPAIAADCAHVTVVQRSPTYFWTGNNRNELADTLRELEIDETWIHEIVRRKILHDQQLVTQLAFEEPEFAATALIEGVRALLPVGYDVEQHFTPKYLPWRQRIAFVPDGDLFAGISSGKASMITGEIDRFTETGLRMTSGQEVQADIIVTATGFDLSVLGGIAFTVDGEPIDFADTVTYRGMMFTGVPNLVCVFGYFRASWTLRADLIGDFVCRLFHHMKDLGVAQVTPALRDKDREDPKLPWMDPENFNPNYLQRSMHLLPKRLDKPEWQHTQDYWVEKDALPAADLNDGCLKYS